MKCKFCGRETTSDEAALYKKLVYRGATDAACIACLAKKFSCSEELLRRKIETFRRMGCVLFAREDDK